MDVASKSADKKKLNLKLLTREVVMELYRYAGTKKVENYIPVVVFDILKYNFDLGSQHSIKYRMQNQNLDQI